MSKHYDRLKLAQPMITALHPIRTAQEVGNILGLSYQAVLQIERKALLKVKVRFLETVRD